MSNIKFQDDAWNEYLYWQEKENKTLKKVNELIKDIERNRFKGICKSEKLKGNLAGYWSRRIDAKNRIVYKITDNIVEIIACNGHYGDR